MPVLMYAAIDQREREKRKRLSIQDLLNSKSTTARLLRVVEAESFLKHFVIIKFVV